MPGKSRDYHKFMSKVDQKGPNGCWIWMGGVRNADGYGLISLSAVCSSKLTHRISFVLHRGPIFNGVCVLHRCDNPPCVNPDHLFLGKEVDNVHDMLKKGRHKTPFKKLTHCKRGHLFTEKSTYIKPDGKRNCKICAATGALNRRLTKQKEVNYGTGI